MPDRLDKFLRFTEIACPIGLVAFCGACNWFIHYGKDVITVIGIGIGIISTISVTILRHFEVRKDISRLYTNYIHLKNCNDELLKDIEKTFNKMDVSVGRIETIISHLHGVVSLISKIEYRSKSKSKSAGRIIVYDNEKDRQIAEINDLDE